MTAAYRHFRRMRRAALLLAPALIAFGCLGPNPNITDDDGTGGTTDETDGDSTSSGDETGDGSGDGTGTDEAPDPTCMDGEQNGNETAEDCGGDCGPCEDGQACAEPEDCISGVCDADVCAAPSCDDEVQNGDEAAIDCGGDCAVCMLDDLRNDWVLGDGQGQQTQPTAAMADDGRFAIAWTNTEANIEARWFDEEGMGTTDNFPAHLDTFPADNHASAVVHENDGDPELVLAWISEFSDGIELRQFDVSGTLTANPGAAINHSAQETVDDVQISIHDDVVMLAWSEAAGAWGLRFDAATDMILDQADLAVVGADLTSGPSVASSESGWVFGWEHDAGDFDFDARYRFRTGAGAFEDAANANMDTDGVQLTPRAAATPDGFVVVWSGASQADAGGGISARLLDADGAPTGGDIQINDILEGTQALPEVVGLRNGFAVAWHDEATDTIRLRRFATDGTPRFDDESPWGSTMNLVADRPAMAANDQDLVLLWTGQGDTDIDIVGVRVAY